MPLLPWQTWIEFTQSRNQKFLIPKHSVSHIIVVLAVPVLHCAWNSTVEEEETEGRSEQKQGQLSYQSKQR